MIPASEALNRLKEGNRRFAADLQGHGSLTCQTRQGKLGGEQEPFAVILGCSDSRVPVEIVFDQCLGDLFVIRVAGNIVASTQIGSVEFAAEKFGTRLVVVLGHSQCGAVLATIDEIERPSASPSPNSLSIVNRILPSVMPLLDCGLDLDHDELVRRAVRANIRTSVDQMRHGSAILETLIRDGGLRIVGAEYSLETGLVEFFDAQPEKR